MLTPIGHVEALFRYPVKSMRGEALEAASLGWHGFEGDRRFAMRRLGDRNGFPWLSASRLPELILFTPERHGDAAGGVPTHVRTPDGGVLPVFSEELAGEIATRLGAPVEMMQMKHGIFDEGSVSVIATETVREIAQAAGCTPDARHFRPNIVVRLLNSGAFQEDQWIGGILSFGEGHNAPAITVTLRDERCAMLNLDPDTARPAPEMLKAAVRLNRNNAGVYATVTRIGRVAVGQPIFLRRNG